MPSLLAALGAKEDDDAAQSRNGETVTVGEIVDAAREVGFGFLIAVLVLVAIPFVGVSTPFGLAIALAGSQMLFGRTRPWLPRSLRKLRIPLATLDRVSNSLARRLRWLERLSRPRWAVALSGPMWSLIGLGIVVLGLGLALPLPIPGSNMIFLVPLFVYALGLLEGDGVLVVVGHAGAAIDVALLIVFAGTVAKALMAVWGWVT